MNHPEISIDETTPVLQVKTNEGFQAALQRYAHGNGSSAGVAGAAVRALVATCTLVDVPKGYKVVLVPDEAAPNEPDWEECKRQAEVSTGLKVEPHTFSILKREVRRWIAHRHSCQAAQAEGSALLQKALRIADSAMFELLAVSCVDHDGHGLVLGLTDANALEVRSLADADENLREAFDWLRERGYVVLAEDSEGEHIVVERRPGE